MSEKENQTIAPETVNQPLDYPMVEIGRETNDVGQTLVHVGGALVGTLDNFKRMIADFDGAQPAPTMSPDDPEFKKAVIAVVLELKRRKVI